MLMKGSTEDKNHNTILHLLELSLSLVLFHKRWGGFVMSLQMMLDYKICLL